MQKLIDEIRAKINEECGAQPGMCDMGDCCSYKFQDILAILESAENRVDSDVAPLSSALDNDDKTRRG